MNDYSVESASITLEFKVVRNRPSVTQGTATVYVNGEKAITFHDEIELIHSGEKYYGPMIGTWASKTPDANFIRGLLYHPIDDFYHYSDSVKKIIERMCNDGFPPTVRE